MDTIQLRASIMRMREIAAKPHGRSSEAEEAEVMTAVLDLLEDFLLDHKRQTELLETLATIADTVEGLTVSETRTR